MTHGSRLQSHPHEVRSRIEHHAELLRRNRRRRSPADQRLHLEPERLEQRHDLGRIGPVEIEPALSRLAKERVQGLVLMPSPLFTAERRRIVKLALAHRWPVIAFRREFTEEGALLSYGIEVLAHYRRDAFYVDKILKGAKPGDLPIEQPTKLELVINGKTAKLLGLNITNEILLRADRVIE